MDPPGGRAGGPGAHPAPREPGLGADGGDEPAIGAAGPAEPPANLRAELVDRRRELEALPLTPIPTTIREDCLTRRRLLDEQIRRLDEELVNRWGDEVRVRRLVTIPGIGPFLAILVVLELADIHRFPSAKHMASYIGLTPRVRASAGSVRVGHISKEGNRLLRWALVVAATQAARRPGPLRTWARLVQRRKGAKIARVALARRLAEIIAQVWKEETDFLAVRRRGGVRG